MSSCVFIFCLCFLPSLNSSVQFLFNVAFLETCIEFLFLSLSLLYLGCCQMLKVALRKTLEVSLFSTVSLESYLTFAVILQLPSRWLIYAVCLVFVFKSYFLFSFFRYLKWYFVSFCATLKLFTSLEILDGLFCSSLPLLRFIFCLLNFFSCFLMENPQCLIFSILPEEMQHMQLHWKRVWKCLCNFMHLKLLVFQSMKHI